MFLKRRSLSLIALILSLCVFAASGLGQQPAITNEEVVNLTKAGLDKEVIIAKIKASKPNFDLSTDSLIKLKEAGVASEVIAAMFGAATPTEPVKPKKLKDDFGDMFKELKNGVVTVWSEFGHGTGFIVSYDGLIVTKFHVLGPSRLASVQFDENRKIEAVIVATNPKDDVAVLWADVSAFAEAKPVRLFSAKGGGLVEEGERVMAVGSPLSLRKIMTTGVVSKVEERAILSDVNINPGNSGGPLFNSFGEVIGINTFGISGGSGPGVSGIVRIELAKPVINEAIEKLSAINRPTARLLPVEPTVAYPIDAIKEVAYLDKFDFGPYTFNVGKFSMTLITPVVKYRWATENERQAMKGRKGRENKSEIKGTMNPFQDLYGWAEYAGEYRPVLQIRAIPELGETGGSIFAKILVGALTGYIPPGGKFRFKADFYKMKLFCGSKEVEPIQPSKGAVLLNERNMLIDIRDATYFGFYTYPADAINEGCGTVRVEIFSEQKPNEAQIENVKPKYIKKLVDDFYPYVEAQKKQQAPQR